MAGRRPRRRSACGGLWEQQQLYIQFHIQQPKLHRDIGAGSAAGRGTCKHGIQALPSISASAKASLEKSCGKMASGSQTAQQEITKQVCVELVNASHIPAGAARERALAVCKAP